MFIRIRALRRFEGKWISPNASKLSLPHARVYYSLRFQPVKTTIIISPPPDKNKEYHDV